MKRSRRVRLVLLGGLSAGALTACGPGGGGAPAVNESSYYTNNFQVPGAGFYHAPYRAWFPLPYNHFDSQTRMYFHGGQWTAAPHQSITNISTPTASAVQGAQPPRSNVPRSGFGSTSRSHSVWS